MPLKIYIDPGFSCRKIIAYVFGLIAINKNIDIVFVDEEGLGDLKITSGSESDFFISRFFYEKLLQGKYGYEFHFSAECLIRDEDGNEDLISTIFYCMNSIQEYNASSDDELGRFQYRNSYQHKYNNVLQNHVQKLIDKVCSHPKINSLTKARRRSKIFLTHDIDNIHGAWKEDGFNALKKMQPGKLFAVLMNEALGKPDWLNMDKIRRIEDEQGFRSVFYWLLYKDKWNADYDFKSKDVQLNFVACNKNGWEGGLHKSLRPISFEEELERIGVPVNGNRYHYLNFKLPEGYGEIEKAQLKLDTSLGFFEQWGFRNSYGIPFMPYNLKEDRVYDLIEVPMQVMDRSFFTRQIPVAEVKKTLIDWFETNKHDCIFSINFHNNFFSEMKYNGYIDLYKSLLEYFRESGFEPTTQTELINEFYRPDKFITN
ncbi:hypothetical protein BH11BAC1_BH11BAC1_29540 [soil metagenome]